MRRWTWPLIVLIVLIGAGSMARSALTQSAKTQLANSLIGLLRADVTALEMWMDSKAQVVRTISTRRVFVAPILELVSRARDGASPEELGSLPQAKVLRERLGEVLPTYHFTGFVIVDVSGKVIASSGTELGSRHLYQASDFVVRSLDGEAVVSRPFLDTAPLEGDQRARPTIYASAPITPGEGKAPVAVLALRLDPRGEFTKLMLAARSGLTGETYAFDAQGVMLSDSRFTKELRQIGLLSDGQTSILNIALRDPGGDLTEGFKPGRSRQALGLTRMVEDATRQREKAVISANVSGYRDYRGVLVVGAYTWLPKHGFGVATEIDVAEAYAPFVILRNSVWGLFALLALAGGGVIIATRLIDHLRRQVSQAERKNQTLGQYVLERKLGSGGMGEVYLARHAMLRRPTAVKLLKADKINETTILRFEREVQQTARLGHPNTISIYDYGRTPEGVFYYAMEYLTGIPLDQLVEREGPLSPGRVVFILRQVCLSLDEAHGVGLIHRDIKPANLMLCKRGSAWDLIKVLDFGLVKDIERGDSVQVSQENAITGTPLTISPEAINAPGSVDGRSDIYGLGAVGYTLLTGKPVFEATSAVKMFVSHLEETPVSPSERLGRPVPEDLEAIILQCLEKDPAKRPQTAYKLYQDLGRCLADREWDNCAARHWWDSNAERLQQDYDSVKPPGGPNGVGETLSIDLRKRVGAR